MFEILACFESKSSERVAKSHSLTPYATWKQGEQISRGRKGRNSGCGLRVYVCLAINQPCACMCMTSSKLHRDLIYFILVSSTGGRSTPQVERKLARPTQSFAPLPTYVVLLACTPFAVVFVPVLLLLR